MPDSLFVLRGLARVPIKAAVPTEGSAPAIGLIRSGPSFRTWPTFLSTCQKRSIAAAPLARR